MKIFLTSLFLIFFINHETEKKSYFFDYFLEYSEKSKGDNFFILMNSKDPSYFYYGHNTDYIKNRGFIVDENSDSAHDFEYRNENNSVQFKFLETRKTNKNNYVNPYVIESNTEKKDSLNTNLTAYAYYKKIRKKHSRKIEATFENCELKMPFRIFNLLSHGTFIDNSIALPKGILSYFSVDYGNGVILKYAITNKKNINTQLNIP
jgi:hypothetical protein